VVHEEGLNPLRDQPQARDAAARAHEPRERNGEDPGGLPGKQPPGPPSTWKVKPRGAVPVLEADGYPDGVWGPTPPPSASLPKTH
jgi:hypothetical protein